MGTYYPKIIIEFKRGMVNWWLVSLPQAEAPVQTNFQDTGSSDLLSQPLLTQPDSEVVHVILIILIGYSKVIIVTIIVLSLPCLLKLSDSSGL